jgi:gliding motility-associated-like protein
VSKFTLLTIVVGVFLQCFSAEAQQVVNSTGNTVADNNVSIEYSVGEIAITTLTQGTNDVTQGLLQPIVQFATDPCKVTGLIPTAFSPNGDGLNDCYGIKGWAYTSSFQLSIYNRWGQLVFKTTDINSCWDGKLQGKDQGTGAYVYFIQATTGCGPVFSKGTLMLIR